MMQLVSNTSSYWLFFSFTVKQSSIGSERNTGQYARRSFTWTVHHVLSVSFQNVTQVVRRAQVVIPLSVLPVLMVTMTTQEHVQVSEYLIS